MEEHAAQEAGHGASTGLPNPMHQFEIKRLIPLELFGFDASFTNSALFMVIAAMLITLFTLYAMRGRSLVPTRLQSVAELSYEFVANMVRDNVGTSGMQYFPFIFTLFMFVLAMNMLGMMPYSFTVTSHIIVTFALAAFIFLAVTAIGFWKHGIGFLKFFVPAGVPAVMLPLLGGDRGDLLSHPALEPVGPSVRQYDGGPHHAQSVRRLRRGARGARRLGAARLHGGLHRLGNSGRVPASLRVRDPHLHLSQRCTPHASLRFNFSLIVLKGDTTWIQQQQN